MEFKIENTSVYGLDKAYKASGNPMRTIIDNSDVNDKDKLRAQKLGGARNGLGHDNFLKGIIVQMDVTAPLYWWKQAQRYHWFDFVSSQSTMHCLLKFNVQTQCASDTNSEVVELVEKLKEKYLQIPDDSPEKTNKWRELVASLPCGFCLGATMTTNYQQLKTMYIQRRAHRLTEWHTFCAWCDTLPDFLELTNVRNI
ncbi:MAG TPA: hypothetical protein PKO28_04450 [Bacilli bacterium]|nr:hypothetical protein [Bacilli bacterium]HPS18968.1 hypothetical protein [Bacilli bacterium]